jgi:hypothetical protein
MVVVDLSRVTAAVVAFTLWLCSVEAQILFHWNLTNLKY